MTNDNRHAAPRVPGREPLARPLPRRFYQAATVAPYVPAGSEAGTGGLFGLLLDGRPARTPRKQPLVMPGGALAAATAAEWEAQVDVIDPSRMPLTRLVNSAIDGVAGREAEVAADIVKYAASDLICYRAEGPAGLVVRQGKAWDPVLTWAAAAHGIRLVLAAGIVHVGQPPLALERIGALLAPLGAYRLAAVHAVTTLTGSALLALALLHERLDGGQAWAAAHVDEDWQIEQWGEDAEAAVRRAARWSEMQAAASLLALADR